MSEKNHLYMLWTSADLETAEKMVFMYAENSKLHGWWEEVTLIIWGPTVKLTAESNKIQQLVSQVSESGVNVTSCRRCAELYGVVSQLESQCIEVIYWGDPLTRILKQNEKIITV